MEKSHDVVREAFRKENRAQTRTAAVYSSEEAVLEKALQLLSSQYLEYDTWVEDTRAKIDEAQLEIDRDEGIPLDTAMAQIDRLRSEIEIGLEQARTGDTVDG
jgi:hypothetical protein